MNESMTTSLLNSTTNHMETRADGQQLLTTIPVWVMAPSKLVTKPTGQLSYPRDRPLTSSSCHLHAGAVPSPHHAFQPRQQQAVCAWFSHSTSTCKTSGCLLGGISGMLSLHAVTKELP